MNSKDAAALLGVDAKFLRKLCRENENLGKQVDGKWSFSKTDIALIRSHIENSKSQKNSSAKKNSIPNEELSEMQKRILSRRDAKLNKEVTERHIQRIERLEQRLRAAGVHLSQHRSDSDA